MNWKMMLIDKDMGLKSAMSQITQLSGLGLFVVSKTGKLLGSLTDGDIRRAFLNGVSLEATVEKVMRSNPYSAKKGCDPTELRKNLVLKDIKQIPILDFDGVIIDVFYEKSASPHKETPIVLMAGGLGQRLGQHTEHCPKPMLKVGNKPILQRIVENFISHGFRKFYFAVNYRAEIIENYFGDGEDFNCDISYLRENKRLGTAGPMSLLPKDLPPEVIVMNGDLLTKVDFSNLLDFHTTNNASVTMSVREYDFQVPYGVVNIEDEQVISFNEKPIQKLYVNGGIYVINTTLLSSIPKDEYFDMSSFLTELLKRDVKPHCYPILERWIDIGSLTDLELARDIYR